MSNWFDVSLNLVVTHSGGYTADSTIENTTNITEVAV